jgi:hypothetical protein
MVWDDATNNMGLHSGLMATHDQETFTFFKDTKVRCFLCPRAGGTEDSYFQVSGGCVWQQLGWQKVRRVGMSTCCHGQ